MIDGVSPNITAMATDLLTQIKQSNLFTGNNYDPVTSFSETIVIVTKKTYDNIAEAEYLVQRLLEGINAQSKERKQYKSDRTEEPTTANNQIALTFHLQEKSGYVDDETKIYSDDTVYIKSMNKYIIPRQLIARGKLLLKIQETDNSLKNLETSAISGEQDSKLKWAREFGQQKRLNTDLKAINTRIIDDLDQLKIIDARDDENSQVWQDIDHLLSKKNENAR